MGAAKKINHKKVLRELVPISALSEAHVEEVTRKAIIEDVRSGGYVFRKGDRDYQSVYLLEGTLELIGAGRAAVTTVKAGCKDALHPLAHKQPRQLSARASGQVTVARIDSSLLDVLLTWDESAGYDVVEIDAHDDDDWMTRMLQSQAFLQLPPSNIHQLLMRLESIEVSAGDVVIRQGEEGDYFYIVKNGRLAVTRKASARGKAVLLAELGEGACFGEEALVSETKRNASVTMMTDGLLMRLSKDDFNELLRAPLVHEVSFAEAQELASNGAQWLDVRLPGEVENQQIKGSTNLPLSALRDQCTELDRDIPYIVCCDTGRRSAAGAFVLSQRGFHVYTLKNGLMDAPDDVLSANGLDRGITEQSRDAEIIPFESEVKTPGEHTAENADQIAQSQLADSALANKLALAEKQIASLQLRLEREEQRVSETQAALEAVELRYKEEHSGVCQARQQIDELNASLSERERQANDQLEAAKHTQLRLEADLAAANQALQAVQSRFDSVAREKSLLEEDQTRLKETLNEVQSSAHGREGTLRSELEQLAKRLDDQQQSHEGQSREWQTELGRLREENQQLHQGNGELAGERETAIADLERTRNDLASIQAELSAQQDEANTKQGSLRNALEQQQRELEEERNRRQSLEQTLGEVNGHREALERELESASERAESGVSRTQELESQLAERDTKCRDLERSLQEAGEREEVLHSELDKLKQQHSHQLEESIKEAATNHTELNERVELLQGQLEDQSNQLQRQLSEREALEKRLQETEESLAQALELERQLKGNSSETQSALDQALADAESLRGQLNEVQDKSVEYDRQVAELDARLVSAEKEHASDIGSLREALSRAQDERENVSREQTRLLGALRKAERDLERERQDHETEVYRLQKALKESAGESSAGLAAEVDALKEQLSAAARLRDDLEVQLGERSAQMENAQSEAAKLKQQLEQACESARQAEEQLTEANQAASEEMTIRLDSEQRAQQALRDELELVTAERNQRQEELSALNDELEKLRATVEQREAESAANEQSVQALHEAERQVQELQTRLGELEKARDEALTFSSQAQKEIDELRAEAEVSRGLVDIHAAMGEGEDRLREDLLETKKNLEVTAGLHQEAEQKVTQLQQQLEYLQAQLGRPDLDDTAKEQTDRETMASEEERCDRPPPEEDELHGPPPPESQPDSELANAEANEAPSQQDSAVEPEADVQIATTGRSGSVKLASAASLLLALAVCGGYWWFSQKSSLVTTADSTPARALADKTGPGDAPDDGENVRQPAETAQNGAETGNDKAPTSVPSFAKGMAALPIPDATDATEDAGTSAAQPSVDQQAQQTEGEGTDTDAEKQVEPAEVQPVRSFSEALASGGTTPTMVEFRADSFKMGSSAASPNFSERPRHSVSLQRFAMSKNEVTFEQYDKFAEATDRSVPRSSGWGRGKRPVINVSWKDAVAYTQWLSEQTGERYRLPTEAEWEFVARAGGEKRFWWGNEVGESRANCFDCGGEWAGKQTAPVGSYATSPYGVNDMAGNVMEWVQDCYRSGYADAPDDGTALELSGCEERVVRGGGYDSPADLLRSTSRSKRQPTVRLDNLGFRVVREF